MAKSKNANLINAKLVKNDEFYTQIADIEREMKHYKHEFEGKTILCNCGDTFESNFFKYFVLNFNLLKLKKLIAVSYKESFMPIMKVNSDIKKDYAYKVEVTKVYDKNNDGQLDMSDIKALFESKENTITKLKGSGDFREDECIEILKQADIVITNPPFSLFREFLTTLVDNEKKFIIIGNKNAITYKEMFPLIQGDEVFMGVNSPQNFKQPDESMKKFGNIGWYTNIYIDNDHPELDLVLEYDPKKYPKYDKYDAIEVSKVVEIPKDYDGVMGVPITFLDKYNPDQFEIVGKDNGPILNGKRIYKRILIKKKPKPVEDENIPDPKEHKNDKEEKCKTK